LSGKGLRPAWAAGVPAENRDEEAPQGNTAAGRPGTVVRPVAARKGGIGASGEPGPSRRPFPELLAPAGSPESYFAAVEAGADAVYLGFRKFSARERAENFTLEDYCRILPHARGRGVKIYLAMNALLTEAELPEAISLLHQVAPLSPDGVIVSDLGLLRIVRDFFPGIPIHVSTQAGCASLAAADRFARLGAQRVILERHLSLPEVRRIVSRARPGVEIFVHGALCYSYSGKCFFSSYLGGRSANRGECVQPCRRLYGHPGGEEAIFSTRDLSLMEILPELVPLGLAAMKIEGRMRSADYVAGVVSAYRTALDRIREGRPEEGVSEGLRILSATAGREPTLGIVGGADPARVVAGGSSGDVGRLLGPVIEDRDGWVYVRCDAPPSRGDRLRVQFRGEGSGRGFSALSLREAAGGFLVQVPFPVSPGDRVFRVGGGGRAELTRMAKREREALAPEGVRFRVAVGEDEVRVEASYGSARRQFAFRVSARGARTGEPLPPDAAERLRGAYRSDLPVGEISVEGGGGAVSWADVTGLFLKAARGFDKEFYLEGKRLRLAILPTLRVKGSRRETLPTVFFVGCTADQLSLLPRVPEVIPVVEFTKAAARDPAAACRGFRDRVHFRLPAPLLEDEAPFYRRTVREALEKGYRRWFAADVGHFELFAGRPRRELEIVSDHYLYAFNTGALAELSSLGASRMVLPVEADLHSLRAVGRYLHELGIAVAYAAVPLMISRLVPAGGVRDAEVRSPREERFFVRTGERGSTVLPAAPFSASGVLHEMRAAGIRDFFADLKGAPAGEIGSILSALFADREIPGTTPFNLFRGGPRTARAATEG
jgi:U32 family peptidase